MEIASMGKRRRLTFCDAAIAVLTKHGAPMHTNEITREAREAGLLESRGKTPQDTMSARIGDELKSGFEKGTKCRFYKHARGEYGMVEWQQQMPYCDAAAKILANNGTAMSALAIAKEAFYLGIIPVTYPNPSKEMLAQLNLEIANGRKDGSPSRFHMPDKECFELAKWIQKQPTLRQAYSHSDLLDDLSGLAQSRLQDLAPADFEMVVMGMLADFGCQQFKQKQRSRYGGFHLKCTLVVGEAIRMGMVVFATNQQGEVDAASVELVRGKLGTYEQGVVFAAGGFSSQARREAARKDAPPVSLIGGERLARLLVKSLSHAQQAQA